MIFSFRAKVLIAIPAIITLVTNVVAQTIEPRRLYEQRCTRYHAPHAGDFVPIIILRPQKMQ